MDFFEHQEAARRKTTQLVLYYVLAVVLIIAVIYVAAIVVFVYAADAYTGQPLTARTFWNPSVLGFITFSTLSVVALGSLYKISMLRRGGAAVAESLGASLIDPSTRDSKERWLLNIVEEMSIASGVPVPPVYLLREESSINAFAAGYSPQDAVVTVTRGTLELLSRDELQGVVAHEFSHILNGDMRLNLRLMGLLHGILLIGLIGESVLRTERHTGGFRRSRSGAERNKGGIILFAIVLLVVGYIGVFFGKLIKAAVSRQREYLADAAAVQFTRNPAGITGALKKIGGLAAGSRLAVGNAEVASHLYFANGLKAPFMRALATHPPLEERILRIDPQWDGAYPQVRTTEVQESDEAGLARSQTASPPSAFTEAQSRMTLSPEVAVAIAGAPTTAHLDFAQALLSGLPNEVMSAAREPFGARALAYALLLSRNRVVRHQQLARLQEHADPGVWRELEQLIPKVISLPREAYLPLVDLSLPALRLLSDGQFEDFRANLHHLIAADRRTSSFELALLSVLRRNLDRQRLPAKPRLTRYHTLRALTDECGVLLSALAEAGHQHAASALLAYDAGIALLSIKQRPTFRAVAMDAVDDALDKLALASPPLKKQLVGACAATIAKDENVTLEEAEILRAVADALEVPIPPFIDLGSAHEDEGAVGVESSAGAESA